MFQSENLLEFHFNWEGTWTLAAQFSKDQRVFLVLEYTKRRGKIGVQNEIIQEFNYKFPNFCGFL